MKSNIIRLFVLVFPVFLIVSCGVHLEKRKYGKGFYISKKQNSLMMNSGKEFSEPRDEFYKGDDNSALEIEKTTVHSNEKLELTYIESEQEVIKKPRIIKDNNMFVLAKSMLVERVNHNNELTYFGSESIRNNKPRDEEPEKSSSADNVKIGAILYGVFGASLFSTLFLLLFGVSSTIIWAVILTGCAAALVSLFFLIRSLTRKDVDTSIGLSAGFMIAIESILLAIVSLILLLITA